MHTATAAPFRHGTVIRIEDRVCVVVGWPYRDLHFAMSVTDFGYLTEMAVWMVSESSFRPQWKEEQR